MSACQTMVTILRIGTTFLFPLILTLGSLVFAQDAGTALAEPPVVAPPPVAGGAAVTLLGALGLGAIVGAGVGTITARIIRWFRRPPRHCKRCRCVRLPLTPPAAPGEPAPDDMATTIETGATPVREFFCRYTCQCDIDGLLPSTHIVWLGFPPPPVDRCPQRVSIEVCWRGPLVEAPRLTIESL